MKHVLFLAGLLSALPVFSQLTPDDILQRADEIRMPSGNYSIDVDAVSTKPHRADQTARYQVLLKGRTKTIIKTMAPATDRGTSFLMLDNDLWVFVQNVSKPVRISMQERLLGEIANGDLARANFVGNYAPSLLKESPAVYVLRLDALRPEVTYGRVVLVVDKATFRPLSAKFYAVSGKLLKTGRYEGYKQIAGDLHPTHLVYTDAIQSDHVSILDYKRMTPEPSLPDKMFNKDYLKKLKY
jgi:outer membrane lipoprotein-sorting protein